MWCEFLDELVESKRTSFFKFVHTTSDFDVDVAVGVDVDIVIVPDFFVGLGTVDAHVLMVWYGGI